MRILKRTSILEDKNHKKYKVYLSEVNTDRCKKSLLEVENDVRNEAIYLAVSVMDVYMDMQIRYSIADDLMKLFIENSILDINMDIIYTYMIDSEWSRNSETYKATYKVYIYEKALKKILKERLKDIDSYTYVETPCREYKKKRSELRTKSNYYLDDTVYYQYKNRYKNKNCKFTEGKNINENVC